MIPRVIFAWAAAIVVFAALWHLAYRACVRRPAETLDERLTPYVGSALDERLVAPHVGCANCLWPISAHCRAHLIPCCPGRCPGRAVVSA